MSGGVSILVVDDESIVRNNIKEMLSHRGHRCLTAKTESEAMHIIDSGFSPESALVDFLIPEGRMSRSIDGDLYGLTGGLRLATFIKREVGDQCRIILNTGLADYRRAAGEAGIWGYLLKPCIDFGVLFDILGQGYLKEDERGKPIIDVNQEIIHRLQRSGKEKRW